MRACVRAEGGGNEWEGVNDRSYWVTHIRDMPEV